MLRSTACRFVRLPAMRRPRERPWEFINKRDFGLVEGAQNFRIMFFFLACSFTILAFEAYREVHNIMMRGDTCAACDEARRVYRAKQLAKERELAEIEKLREKNSQATAKMF